MKLSQDAILQAAATIAAAKIQVSGTFAAANGLEAVAFAEERGIKAAKIMEESIAEVLSAIDSIEKTKTSVTRTWHEQGNQ